MTQKAFIETDSEGKQRITIICANPSKNYHADIAALFVNVPNSAEVGFIKDGSTWKAEAASSIAIDNGIAKSQQTSRKPLFMTHVTAADRAKYRAAVKDGSNDLVNDLELTWGSGGTVWLLDNAANTEYKNVLTDLKTAGILSDASIAKITTAFSLDKTPPNL